MKTHSPNHAMAPNRIEAPVTPRGYVLCVFAAFGAILFGYDSGYINGMLGIPFSKQQFGSESVPICDIALVYTPSTY